MKKILFLLIFMICTFFAGTISAQLPQTGCGTPSPDPSLVMSSKKVNKVLQNRMASDYIVRVMVHVLRRSDGTWGATEQEINDQFSNFVVPNFAPTNITFDIIGISFIDNTTWASTAGSVPAENLTSGTLYPMFGSTDRLDIFVFPTEGGDKRGNAFGIPNDYLMVTEGRFGNIGNLTHEIGHTLGLLHTHETYGETCPSIFIEKVNGDDCATGGDLCCDTAADPQLGGNWDTSTCTYSGNATDCNGDMYTPPGFNFMSYGWLCRNSFSTCQINRMNAELEDGDVGPDMLGVCELEVSCSAISNVTVACSEDVPDPDLNLPIILSACNPAVVTPFDNVDLGTTCPGSPTIITRVYTITDSNMGSETCEQTITIVSNVGPTITCPATMVETCIEDFNELANRAMVSSTAECGVATISLVSGPTLDVPGVVNNCNGATYSITYRATDDCDRTAECTQEIAIVNDPPTIDCDPDETVECVEDISPSNADVTVVTSCDVSSNIVISGPVMFGQDGCDGTVYQYTYTVTDACGREASCTRSYTLENDGPTIDAPADMIVDCFSSISVDANNATVEYACTLGGTVEVSDPVQVGDDDCPGTTYTYTYTVTDECGRSASDDQIFTIENDPPTIDAPADQTVECAFDIETDINAVVVTTSCMLGSEVILSGPVQAGPSNCPGTTYTYTYTVTDDCGRVASDDQVFTIGDNDPPTIAVVPTITVDCFESINPDPNFADVTTACNNGVDFEVTVTDPVLGFGQNCPGETYSVVYTITDACGRTASATQTFVIDNEGPTMECPDNCEVLTCYDGDYEAIIEAWINTVEATSSCSVDLTVFNTYNGVNGICVDNGFTPVTFSATDACGRSVSCESGIFITDTDAPDIYETPEDLLVPCTANTEQIFSDWLADYGGAEAVDACGGPVTWSADTGVNALNCANGPQAIVVTFTATDGCGNSASVVGTFNTKLLPDAVNVAGLIQTEAAEAVASVEVAAYQSSGMTEMDMSTQTGDYHFEELPYEENTEIVPNKDDDYLNGVTTYDLILLQQHILGIQTLNSPYKQIAADANRSGTISTLDLVMLRRLILHIDEELADNTSWRFVDADFVFPNADNPFETDFPEVYTLSGLEEELKDFVAVKIGDLNLDAATNNLSESEDRSGLDNLEVIAEDQKLAAGQDYIVNLSAANFASINGFQFTLNFDQTAVEVLDIESADLADFNQMNYGMSKIEEGAVTISWNTNTAESLASTDAMFKVVLRSNANVQLSEVLSITSNYTKAEAYQGGELMNVSLNFSDNGTLVTTQSLRLYQNQPNPFKDATMIGFDLPKAGAVDFMIYDLTGKLVYRAQGDYAAGYNQIEVDRSDLPNGGVFYYHINTDEDSASKKMILID